MTTATPDDGIYEALAEWYLRLDAEEATEADREAFALWLVGSRARQSAHAAMAAGMSALAVAALDGALFETHLAPLLAADAGSAADRSEHTVVPIKSYRRYVPSWRAAASIAAGLALICVLGVTAAFTDRAGYTPVATAVGAVQSLATDDGSTIHVNTDTRLAYSIGPERRKVQFERGEAYFEVAPDSSRPFIISVGDHTITVVGTAFNLRSIGGTVVLTVTKGVTRVEPSLFKSAWLGGERRLVKAGTAARFDDDSPIAVESVQAIDAVGSWRHGQLVYHDRPIAEIITDISRYVKSELILTDPARGQQRHTVVLQIDQESVMLERMRQLLPIRLREVRQGVYEVDVDDG